MGLLRVQHFVRQVAVTLAGREENNDELTTALKSLTARDGSPGAAEENENT